MERFYSFIIPVYNRPEEIGELLHSMLQLDFDRPFEVVIVEDGSSQTSEEIVERFSKNLEISYFKKPNSGPGASRNYGMERAQGNYFIILDSDVLLPANYLKEVDKSLQEEFVPCFGGPDAAHRDFTSIQKAINYAMTSLFTTGGIRGSKNFKNKFQPRSFNMGLSKEAFKASGGFGNIHPGEDPDLALRLQKMGFETKLFPEAVVFHKRRIDFTKFYKQVYKFGLVRPILNKWHPQSAKITYWFPTFFCFGLFFSLVLVFLGVIFPVLIFLLYFLLIFMHAAFLNKSLKIGFYSVFAGLVQFMGYGFGFCRATYYIRFLKAEPREKFSELFFKNGK